MSGLATALRLRRRQLDGLALKIASVRGTISRLEDQSAALQEKREEERARAPLVAFPSDHWFARCARLLADLEAGCAAENDTLAALRCEAIGVRARLRLLEEAEADSRRAARRRRERRAQTLLDDRTAALWRPS